MYHRVYISPTYMYCNLSVHVFKLTSVTGFLRCRYNFPFRYYFWFLFKYLKYEKKNLLKGFSSIMCHSFKYRLTKLKTISQTGLLGAWLYTPVAMGLKHLQSKMIRRWWWNSIFFFHIVYLTICTIKKVSNMQCFHHNFSSPEHLNFYLNNSIFCGQIQPQLQEISYTV